MGRVALAGANWTMLVLLAKLTSRADVGQYALAVAIAAPVMTASRLYLRSILATDQRREFAVVDYTATAFIMAATGFLASCGLAMLLDDVASRMLVLVVASYFAIESFCELMYGVFQREERMDFVGWSMLWRGISTIVIAGTVLWVTGSMLMAMAGVLVTTAAVLLFHDLMMARSLLSRRCEAEPATQFSVFVLHQWPCVRSIGLLFLRGFPLGLTTLVLLLDNNVPRYFIEPLCGTSALGLFAAVSSLVVIGSMISTGISQAALPRLSRFYADQDYTNFRRLVLKCAGIAMTIGVTGIVVSVTLGEAVLTTFFTEKYRNGSSLLVVVSIYGLATYIGDVVGSAVISMRRFWILFPVNSSSLAVVILACWLIVPRWSLLGAAWALVISAVLRTFLFSAIIAYQTLNRDSRLRLWS